ncbi:MAG: hypothetical protein ACREJ5_17700, partial [Geminicoccaceae bacterium]
MRRILRRIAANEYDQLGDTSTVADPSVVHDLVENRMNRERIFRSARPSPLPLPPTPRVPSVGGWEG